MNLGKHISKLRDDGTLVPKANTGALVTLPSREEMEDKMRRRHQDPRPRKHGKYWTIVVWKDEFQNGKPQHRQVRVRLAPIATKWRELLRLKDEYLRPLNQGLVSIGSATNFRKYVEQTYILLEMRLLAKTTPRALFGRVGALPAPDVRRSLLEQTHADGSAKVLL